MILRFVVLLIFQYLSVIFSFLSAYFVRAYVFVDVLPFFEPPFPIRTLWDYFPLTLVWLLFFFYEGFFTKRLRSWEKFYRFWKANIMSTLIVFSILFFTRGVLVSRFILFLGFLLLGIYFPLFLAMAEWLLRRLDFSKKTLLLVFEETEGFVRDFKHFKREYGLDVVGVFREITHEFEKKVREEKIETLVIVGSFFDSQNYRKIEEITKGYVKEYIFIPKLEGLRVLDMEVLQVGTNVFFRLKTPLKSPENLLIKNLMDYTLAIVLLFFFAPLFLVIALMIRLDSKGPIFFKQKRVGKGGKEFNLLKFRTMFVDSESMLKKVLEDEEKRREWIERKKLKTDPRITRVGRFLRRFSLDELPQLVNILKGEMSLVGPRPYLKEELEEIRGFDLDAILSVKPGLTGLWQISGRASLSFRERAALDEYYVRNWSPSLDLMIILVSLPKIIKGEGAY